MASRRRRNRKAFLKLCDAAQLRAPILLDALERRYGNQQEAGVHRIAEGASGVAPCRRRMRALAGGAAGAAGP